MRTPYRCLHTSVVVRNHNPALSFEKELPMIHIRISSLKPRAIHAARFANLLSVVLFAGITPPASAQTSGTWTTTGSLNTPRQGHTATLLAHNQVLVVGGTAAGGILNSAELYNPATGRWTVTGNMATSRIEIGRAHV